MNVRPIRVLAALVVLATPLAAVGCGGGDESAGSDNTTTTAAAKPCAQVYLAGSGQPEGPEAIDSRGEPQMQSCDPEGSDLQVIDEVVGTGAEVVPGDTVTVQYTGVGASTGTVFDSSWSRGQSISFALDQVIQGWTDGLVGMKVGGRRTLVIPPEMGYGNGGPAPGDTLVFTIDLVGIDSGAAGPDGSSTTVND